MKTLPFRIQTLYIHALQSHIFNEAAKRLDTEDDMILPLVGFGTEFDDEKIKDLMEDIMFDEGISSRDFIIKAIPVETSMAISTI